MDDTNDTVMRRLRAVAQLYQQGQVSALMDRTLEKLLSYEADVCRAQINQLQADLDEYEKRYDLSSSEFYQRFQSGQTDDRMDYVEWASLIQMRDNLQEQLRLLTNDDYC